MKILTLAATCLAVALLVPSANAAMPVGPSTGINAPKASVVHPVQKVKMNKKAKFASAKVCKPGTKAMRNKCVPIAMKKK